MSEPEVTEMPAPEKTEEQKKAEELNERVNGFIKEYGELVKKYQVDYAIYPMFVPDGQGGFKIITQSTPVDVANQPMKSPFIPTTS